MNDRELNRAINQDFADLLGGPVAKREPKPPVDPTEPLNASVLYALCAGCPACNASIGVRCTRGGKPMRGVHSDRGDAAYRRGYRSGKAVVTEAEWARAFAFHEGHATEDPWRHADCTVCMTTVGQ